MFSIGNRQGQGIMKHYFLLKKKVLYYKFYIVAESNVCDYPANYAGIEVKHID